MEICTKCLTQSDKCICKKEQGKMSAELALLSAKRDYLVRQMWTILNTISHAVDIDDFTAEDMKLWAAVTEHSAVQNKSRVLAGLLYRLVLWRQQFKWALIKCCTYAVQEVRA